MRNCPVAPPPADFVEVIKARRSRRLIRRAPLREVLNCLLFASAPSSAWNEAGQQRTRRLAHSAGGLHSVEILLVAGGLCRRILRLKDGKTFIELMRPGDPEELARFAAKMSGIFPEADCHRVVLLADPAIADAFYTNAESLLWRDAGAMMQVLHNCAAAYRLEFCPAGVLGSEVVHALFGPATRLRAYGAAIIGRAR